MSDFTDEGEMDYAEALAEGRVSNQPGHQTSGPSDKAISSSHMIYNTSPLDRPDTVIPILEAAHNPALGLDRSVCLRDVVEKLRGWDDPNLRKMFGPSADFIEREFTA